MTIHFYWQAKDFPLKGSVVFIKPIIKLLYGETVCWLRYFNRIGTYKLWSFNRIRSISRKNKRLDAFTLKLAKDMALVKEPFSPSKALLLEVWTILLTFFFFRKIRYYFIKLLKKKNVVTISKPNNNYYEIGIWLRK